jgi:hypothetical protein
MSRGPLVANVSELRSVENLEPVHFRQLLTYLRLSGLRPGLLINFAEAVLKNGIRQIANNLQSETLASWRLGVRFLVPAWRALASSLIERPRPRQRWFPRSAYPRRSRRGP